jgi:DNA-binding NarL/FixJ family response regulator
MIENRWTRRAKQLLATRARPAVRVVRVLLVDDSPILIDAVQRLLALHPHLEVVGAVGTSAEAVAATGTMAPDLVLMDLSLPDMSGLDTTRLIKSHPNPPRVIVLTPTDAAAYCMAAASVAADGYLDKAELGGSLLALIDALFAPDGSG